MPKKRAKAKTPTRVIGIGASAKELTALNDQLQDKVSELTAANDDLANLLANTEIATVFVDAHLRVKRFTTTAAHVLNLRAVDVGRPLEHIAPHLVQANLSALAKQVLKEKAAVEQDIVDRGGRQFVVRALPYRTQHRDVHGVVLTLFDVSALKQSERELREARQQLLDANANLEQQVVERTRSLGQALDAAKAGTWHIDFGSNHIVWGDRARAMLGVTANRPQPLDSMFGLVHAWDRPRLQQHFEVLKLTANTRWEETFRVLRDGNIVWVRAIGEAERDAMARLLTLGGIILDVTTQKLAEAALLESRQEQQETADTLQSFLAFTSEGVLSQDAQGKITHANQAAHAMFGYGPGELIGQPLERLIPESSRRNHAQHVANFWREKRSREMGLGTSLDLSGARKDGTRFPVDVALTFVPTPPPSGRVFALVSDITARKRAQDELRSSHEQLRQRADQLRRLASDLTLTEQQTRERLARLVHDDVQQLLFSAKMRMDRLSTSRSPRSNSAMVAVNKAREDLDQAIAAARSLSIELFPPTLHQDGLAVALSWLANWMREKYALTVEVTADPRAELNQKDHRTLIFESVRELLFNVVKHSKVSRAIADLALTADNRIQVTIADHGAGFDPQVILNKQTVGWGLFSIRERLTLLGGSLEIESAPGHGARFTLTLPCHDTPT